MPLTDAITDSLRLEDPYQSASAVHKVVGDVLGRIAPDVSIKATDYFTHSFAPDLVLSWSPNGERESRNVHLRFGVDNLTFVDGAALLADTEPIFIGLSGGAPIDPRVTRHAERGLADTLITSASALDAMDETRALDRPAIRATQEVVRGGRGAVDAGRASRIVGAYQEVGRVITELDKGSDPVSAEAISRTNAALKVLHRALRPPRFRALEADLRSRWIGTGGDPTEFPGRTEWDPRSLTNAELGEVLNALLDSDRKLSPDAWIRNAGHLRAEQLAAVLGKPRHGGTLDDLATALLSNWTAGWAWAEQRGPELLELWRWMIVRETGQVEWRLGLQLGDLRVFFSDDGSRFAQKKATGDRLPTVLERRMLLGNPAVQAVTLRTEKEAITYQLDDDAGATMYERLTENQAQALDRLRVESLTTQLPGYTHAARIELDRKVIDVREHPTPILTLTRLAYDFFSSDSPKPWWQITRFLTTGRAPGPGDAPEPERNQEGTSLHD